MASFRPIRIWLLYRDTISPNPSFSEPLLSSTKEVNTGIARELSLTTHQPELTVSKPYSFTVLGKFRGFPGRTHEFTVPGAPPGQWKARQCLPNGNPDHSKNRDPGWWMGFGVGCLACFQPGNSGGVHNLPSFRLTRGSPMSKYRKQRALPFSEGRLMVVPSSVGILGSADPRAWTAGHPVQIPPPLNLR